MPSINKGESRLSSLLHEYDVLKENIKALEARYQELTIPSQVEAARKRLEQVQRDVQVAEERVAKLQLDEQDIKLATIERIQLAALEAKERVKQAEDESAYRMNQDRVKLVNLQKVCEAAQESLAGREKEVVKQEHLLSEKQAAFSFKLKDLMQQWSHFKKEGDQFLG